MDNAENLELTTISVYVISNSRIRRYTAKISPFRLHFKTGNNQE